MFNISRKSFLKGTVSAAVLFSLNRFFPDEPEAAELPAGSGSAFLIHVLLNGGPDIRQLIVPKPSSDETQYGYHFWLNRTGLYGAGAGPDQWAGYFSAEYEEMTSYLNGNQPFGILKKADWLISEYRNGRVAFVNNIKHSESRDHARSLLVVQSGLYETPAYATGRDGIGGLISQNASGRVLSFTGSVLPFCKNNAVSDIAVSFRDSRNFGLYVPDASRLTLSNGMVSGYRTASDYRALHSYYKAKSAEKPVMKEYHQKPITHFEQIAAYTESVRSRLDMYPQPDSVKLLYQNVSGTASVMSDRGFGIQAASLYDAYLTSDIHSFRVGSLSMGGWDTHKWQQNTLEPKFQDLFGTGRSFSTVFSEIPDAFSRSILVFIGDFGRQLKANGADSTDHGDGNTVILAGGLVRGGVYGEMWPQREITPGTDGKRPLEKYHQGIQGRTNLSGLYSGIVSRMTGSNQTSSALFGYSPVYESGWGDIANIIL